MDAELLSMWREINLRHFAGELEEPTTIFWEPLTGGPDSLEAFAIYLPYARSIAIDSRFQFDPERIESDETEGAKLEAAYRILIHEMIHQAQYQRKSPSPGGHGKSFIEIATPVAESLGLSAPTADDAPEWPDLRGLLRTFGL